MGEAPHSPSRVLDGGDRVLEPGSLLPAAMGDARGAHPEIWRIWSRSRMDQRPRRDRKERSDCCVRHQYDPAAAQLLVGKVRGETTCSTSSASITACRAVFQIC